MNIRFNAFSTLQLLFILSTPLFFNPTVSAQCHTFSEVTKFLNSAISANDRIGLAIAMDGNTAAIGAVGENPSSVYIAERSNGDWIETQRIMGSNGTNFGHSVAIEGNRLVIGAPFLEQAFVYEKNNGVWSLIRTLEANDKVLGNQFGISVDISGTRVVVGANGVNNFTGAAYIFRQDGNLWTQDKIIPSMGTANGFFGDAVGISGTKVIVGAPQEENLEGAVYIFENSFFNWSEVARIKAASPGIINQFGRSVDIEGNTAIIGEEGYDLIKNDAGAIHVLERSNGSWQTTQVLTPIRSGAGAKFGYRVSLSGRHIIGGAPQDDEIGIGADSGSATIFVKNNGSWEEKKRLAASDEAASDRFGWSVAISGETAVVGSPLHDEMDSNVGAAYFFACQPNDCYNQLNITGNSPDNFIPEGDYLAAQHIISNAIIDADSMVVFKAGQSITLNSGFTVSAGGQFTATIDACTPPAVIWNDEIALRNHFKEEHSIQYSSEAIELFPNPVEDVCNLNFSLPNREKVSIRIIDQMGKTVLIPLNNQYFQQGKHRVHFSTCSLALGMYFVVVQMKDEQLVKRLVLQR